MTIRTKFSKTGLTGFFLSIVKLSSLLWCLPLFTGAVYPGSALGLGTAGTLPEPGNSGHLTLASGTAARAPAEGARATEFGKGAAQRVKRPGFTNSLGMEFVRLDGGDFIMGSPTNEKGRDKDEALHGVALTRRFFIQTTEVTVGQWRRFVKDTGFRTDAEKQGGVYIRQGSGWNKKGGINWETPGFPSSDNHPVTCISWDDAVEFIRWLNRREKKRYALPTEAHWEYAARAGTRTARFWGEDAGSACEYANVHDASAKRGNSAANWPAHACDDGFVKAAPVGSFKPNPFGLHDMMGNVWEWCRDWYGGYDRFDSVDPRGPTGGTGRIIRGGGWDGGPANIRSALRERAWPVRQSNDLGFRLVTEED